jgi:divalent metal cation (Fe/Co/Zn/Cd) transporter
MSDHALGRRLQWATIPWNVAEVFVTMALGFAAGSLALVAFGLDSLIEVFASLVVLWHMSPDDGAHPTRDRRAQRLVASAFAVLAVFLLVISVRTLWIGAEPDSSPIGIAYLTVTAVVMFTLARAKRRIGLRLESEPFLAEASMTFLDGGLATGILTALVLNSAFGWWWADPVAAILVGLVAANEAIEGSAAMAESGNTESGNRISP